MDITGKFLSLSLFFLLASTDILYTQNQLIPFAVGNQWIYHVREYSGGMTGNRDTVYYDTVSVIGSMTIGNDTIWVLSNGNEFVAHNDSIFSFSAGTTMLKYVPASAIPAVLSSGASFSFIADTIKTPFGNFVSGISLQFSMIGESGGTAYYEAIVPGVGIIFDSTVTTWPEYFGTKVKRLMSFTKNVLSVSKEVIATGYSLSQNFPNPFNPTTVISYQLPVTSTVTLKIFDLLGREVATLVNEEKSAGSYEVHWNAMGFASGVYFYQLQSGEFVQTKKLILQK